MHFDRFSRNLPLEQRIALILARQNHFFISAFLDLLDQQLDYYASPVNHCDLAFSDLARTLQTLRRHFWQLHSRDFTADERAYLDRLKEYIETLDDRISGPPTVRLSIQEQFSQLVFSCTSSQQLMARLEEYPGLRRRFPVIAPQQDNLILCWNNETFFIVLFNAAHYPDHFPEGDNHLFIPDERVNDETIGQWVNHHSVKSLWLQGCEQLRHYGAITWQIQREIAEYQRVISDYCQQQNIADDNRDFSKINGRLEALTSYLLEPPLLQNPGLYAKKCGEYIQLIRNSLVELHSVKSWYYPRALDNRLKTLRDKIRYKIDLLLNQVEISISLDRAIRFSIAQVKSSSALYLTINREAKSHEMAFGEQNLAAVVASTLRGIYLGQPHISVNTEVQLAQGRTDITLKNGNTISGHIEFKLVRPQADIAEKTLDALQQVYERYGENDGIDDRWHVPLYIVIFAHDKRYATFAEKIWQTCERYAANEKLIFKPVETAASENSFSFLLTTPQSHFGMRDKTRLVTVIVCNLEIEHQKRKAAVTNKANFTDKKRPG